MPHKSAHLFKKSERFTDNHSEDYAEIKRFAKSCKIRYLIVKSQIKRSNQLLPYLGPSGGMADAGDLKSPAYNGRMGSTPISASGRNYIKCSLLHMKIINRS